MGKKILITGGAGYIGSMLATSLIKSGYSVTVVDLLKYNSNSLSHLYYFKKFKLIKKDARNINTMKVLIKKHDIIIPLAALVGAPLCEKYKSLAKTTNFKAIQDIIKNMSKNKKIIYITSNSGYGVGKKNKFCDETSELKPISLYGKTKCDAENSVMKHKNSICFRLATVFGCSYRMRSDLIVNNFVYRSLYLKKIEIFEPHFRRNFIHIRDVVNGIIFSIKNFDKLKSNIYNLGLSTANITKIQLARKIKQYNKNFKISVIKNRKDPDQRDYFVSNKKIEKKGFKASISLDKGIKELLTYFKHNKEKILNNY